MRDGIVRHITIGVLAVGLLSGCATTIRVGTPPRTDRLKELRVGVSTTKDVLLVLGEPRGRGAARSSVVNEPRKILYYEYMEAEGLRIGLKLLVVFLREDRYDGHLWFSSSQLIEEARR
jgi:hypothetical protein